MTYYKSPCYLRIQQLHKKGISAKAISKKVCRSISTIRRWTRLIPVPNYSRVWSKRGRNPILTEEVKEKLLEYLMAERLYGCKKLRERIFLQFHINISTRSLHRLMKSGKLRWGEPKARAPLKPRDRRKRYLWCVRHKDWTVAMWRKYIFSDEKIFRAGKGPRGIRYKIGERPIKLARRYGPSFHVWWAISGSQTFPVVRVSGKLDALGYQDILEEAFYGNYENDMTFLQDGAPPHRAKSTKDWLDAKEVNWVKDFPPYSPDLNPIENLWGYADYAFRIAEAKGSTSLEETVRTELMSIPHETILKFIDSMPRRIQACIRARGGHTKY